MSRGEFLKINGGPGLSNGTGPSSKQSDESWGIVSALILSAAAIFWILTKLKPFAEEVVQRPASPKGRITLTAVVLVLAVIWNSVRVNLRLTYGTVALGVSMFFVSQSVEHLQPDLGAATALLFGSAYFMTKSIDDIREGLKQRRERIAAKLLKLTNDQIALPLAETAEAR